MFTEILVVIVLTVINGVLAMSELAVVSSRPARLKVLSDQGSKGAAKAIKLAENPGRFLSTVQIGITLVGVLSGAFSGATLGARLSEWLGTHGFSNADAERVAARVAPAMVMLAKVSLPLVWLLDASGKLVLALLGQKGEPEETVTEEEVRTIIAEAENAGVLERDEREMISGVMRFADRSARAL
ncbi:MAG: DUF21 domain-containing protein, partial [Hyphomicrobiales bacterium]